MNSRVMLEVNPSTLRALLDFQSEQGGELDLAALAEQAISEWLQLQRTRAKPLAPPGYFWKTVFLPEGTRLRVKSCHGAHFAEVIGCRLVHDSQCFSPNQFVTASLGNVGNAWNLIYVQLPGESDWTQARRLRYEIEAHARRTARHKLTLTNGVPNRR